jgi:DNA-binding FadR family transcriptional regulator
MAIKKAGRTAASVTVRSQRRLLRVHGTVAQEIGTAIASGKLPPGELLENEIDAAKRMSVSRNTYREAMRMLVAKGLVVSRTRTGTRVTDVADWNVLDPDVLAWTFAGTPRTEVIHGLFELRSVIEPTAAALAAARRGPKHLDRMSSALAQMQRHTLHTPAGREADSEFHAALLDSTCNPFVISMTRSVTAAITALTEFKLRLSPVQHDPVPDHERVYDAIVAQDDVAARDAMLELIRLAILDLPASEQPGLSRPFG